MDFILEVQSWFIVMFRCEWLLFLGLGAVALEEIERLLQRLWMVFDLQARVIDRLVLSLMLDTGLAVLFRQEQNSFMMVWVLSKLASSLGRVWAIRLEQTSLWIFSQNRWLSFSFHLFLIFYRLCMCCLSCVILEKLSCLLFQNTCQGESWTLFLERRGSIYSTAKSFFSCFLLLCRNCFLFMALSVLIGAGLLLGMLRFLGMSAPSPHAEGQKSVCRLYQKGSVHFIDPEIVFIILITSFIVSLSSPSPFFLPLISL